MTLGRERKGQEPKSCSPQPPLALGQTKAALLLCPEPLWGCLGAQADPTPVFSVLLTLLKESRIRI